MDRSLNEAGSIKEVVDLVLQFKDHLEHVPSAVTSLSKQDLILGFPWLCEHNPEVDWKTGNVKMSHCPQHCHTCFLEEKKQRKENKKKEEKIQVCRSGPMPELMEELEEEEEEEMEEEPEWVMDPDPEEGDSEEKIEEGD